MNASKRIIVNTVAQYGKSVINILLSLYSTRLVLNALNVNDYGIYSVVGGVVGILGYLTNSLVVTTQRYLSFYHGQGDIKKTQALFINSILLHLLIGLIFVGILMLLEDFLINHFLNIDSCRLEAARLVYVATVLMMFVTVITAPFKALFIARENIVYISSVEVCDGLLKLCLALSLFVIGFDKLMFYAYGMAIILVVNLLAYVVYAELKYKESHIIFSRRVVNRQYINQLLGFAGWTTYGMLAGMCQTQGLSIVFNKFFGTAINAAFGIGMQVNGAVRFVSTSVLNAMNPQIMKAEGMGDRDKMLRLASKESKFSTALMLMISIPIIAEMPDILKFWLKIVPPHSVLFCRTLMLTFLFDQFTMGLHSANQAIGKIRSYSLLTYTPKIMIIPLACFILLLNESLLWVMVMYAATELMVSLFRIPFLHKTAGLNMREYLKSVVLPLIPIIVCEGSVCLLFVLGLDCPYRFLLTLAVACSAGIASMYFFSLNNDERTFVTNFIKHPKR